jgi:hypothetical protein
MFVKEKGVIGCGHGSCGDDTKFDYTMCQACSTSYKLQPPDYATSLEIFPSTVLSDAVLMLPHPSPTSCEPVVNRAGAVVKPGKSMIIYCGRKLGRDLIPGSNGVCGPSSGPQCPDCAFSFPVDVSQLPVGAFGQGHPPFGQGYPPFGQVPPPFGSAAHPSFGQGYPPFGQVQLALIAPQ